MVRAGDFLTLCLDRGFSFFTGTPCSYLKPIINYVIDNDEFRFINAANEGDAIALACGASLAGKRSVVMFQNSGLGNAVNPITSLNYTFRIPLLLIVTLRGESSGSGDEPQHELMGKITTDLLETMRIKWSYLPETAEDMVTVFEEADTYMSKENLPFAFVMRKNDIEPYKLSSSIDSKPRSHTVSYEEKYHNQDICGPTRNEVLRSIQTFTGEGTAIIATTGYAGRELCMLEDRDNQLYMVGSMGCALSIGTGIALNKPGLKVIVIDGDGALLMRASAMASTCNCMPTNLIHILLDNEVHESTGGQMTLSNNVSFPAIAKGFGYTHVFSTDIIDEFKNFLAQSMEKNGPIFIHLKTRPGIPKGLGRPAIKPVQVKERFMKYLGTFHKSCKYV